MIRNLRDKAIVPDDERSRFENTKMATGGEQSVLMSSNGCFDGTGSNPQRNSIAEVTRTESRTLSFTNTHKIGMCNGRRMHQGKLDVVKKEMEKTITETFWISELRFTGLG